ncbi:calcium-binding protein [Bradyrhizobium liaoningense]
MQHLPNDTIDVSLDQFGQIETVYGDPGFPAARDVWGGNDTVTATVTELNTRLTIFGDDHTMLLGHSQGGNDTLIADIGGGWNTGLLVGDTQSMIDDARGGNDTIVADAHGTVYTTVSAFGDVAGDLSGNAQGGNDDITGSIGWRGGANLFAGDAGGSMIDTSHGGNDTLDVSVLTIDGAATVSGDAIGALRGLAQGGNDSLTVTLNGDSPISGASLSGDSSTSLMDFAQGGDDVLTVQIDGQYADAASSLFGDAPIMAGHSQGGNDILDGGAGRDFMYGDARTYEPASRGSITGGIDTLNGGAGDDQMWGGGNSDLFVFNTGSGNDTINDFDQGNKAVGSTAAEHDLIDVQDYGFADWAALSKLISDNAAGDAVIHLSANDAITLDGVQAANLHPTDFII